MKSTALIASVVLLSAAQTATASHHFETPLAREYPAYDLTDLYVFDSNEGKATTFVIDVNPQTKADGKALFGENGIYNIHIATDVELVAGQTITVRFEQGQAIFGVLGSANGKLGEAGKEFGRAAVGKEVSFDNGVRVWTGAARDPFVGNSAGLGAFRNSLVAGKFDLSVFQGGVDLFKSFNTSAIVVQVPNAQLPAEIHVYATSAMRLEGSWQQVNRLANPLLTHLFMYDNAAEKFEHVHHRPDSDAERRYVVSGTVLRAAVLSGHQDPVGYADTVARTLLPDLLSYKVGTPASYRYPERNGRRLTDDAMDTAISLFVGKSVTDHANLFDRHPADFPYLVRLPVSPSAGE
ncbi:MAG TPA: DUF4331 family protein [Fontimonas sp.]